MSFFGIVTKAGFMNKTATVTVSRWVIDIKTGKVRECQAKYQLDASSTLTNPAHIS
jgi:small subunit ribosomal protein S17